MPAVQVRDFSDEIYEMLKAEAKENGRSITQQTKVIVVDHFLNKSAQQHNESVSVPTQRADLYDARPVEMSKLQHLAHSDRRLQLWQRIEESANRLALPDDAPTAEELVREMRDAR